MPEFCMIKDDGPFFLGYEVLGLYKYLDLDSIIKNAATQE